MTRNSHRPGRARRGRRHALMATALALLACSGGSDSSIVAPAVLINPVNRTVVLGHSATFHGLASSGSLQWRRNGVAIAGATGTSYTIGAVQTADSGAHFDVVASSDDGTAVTTAATLTVLAAPAPTDVLTYHNDPGRSGLNATETLLTAASVTRGNFGLVGALATDGHVDAEPLIASAVTIGGAPHNVLIVVTEHDSVYAFDADTLAKLWQVSVLGAGETPSDTRNCSQITPEIGITATPVIDRAHGPAGAIYVAAMSKTAAGQYVQRLHALDLASGAELIPPAQVAAAYTTNAGTVTFTASQYAERAALLELNDQIYLTWTSHCDIAPYNGWITRFSAAALQPTGVLSLTTTGSDGGIWMAGAGPAADAAGGVYLLDGNGTFDTSLDGGGFPSQGNFGNSFVRLGTSAPASLSVADYFAMHDTIAESAADQDLGSGGVIALPDLADASGATRHLAVGAGKDARIYLVDRDNMGKFNPGADTGIYQEIPTGLLAGGVFSAPAYFAQTVYYGAVNDHLKAIKLTQARLEMQAASQSGVAYAYPGTTPSISASSATSGIVWTIENNSAGGVLHAQDAGNLANELYHSEPRSEIFADNKFVTPMVADGRVFVGTPSGVAVFGILP